LSRVRALLALVLGLALTGCGQASAPAPQTEPAPEAAAPTAEVISPEGYGPVRIGMSVESANTALGGILVADEPLDDPQGCRTWNTGGPSAVYYMSDQDRITRISFVDGSEAIRTAEGVGVGSSDAEVRAAYPNAVEQGAAYADAPAHDLLVWAVPDKSGLRFEINDEGRVTALHAGNETILYIEGCA
jgi:hypothetical protein